MQGDSKESVCGIVFDKERASVLLIKRRDIPVWTLPGGGLDSGESPEEGTTRELEEETGCQVKIVRKVAEYLPVNKMTRFTHFFECEIVGGSAQTGAETQGVGFFPLDALPLLPPPYADWIKDAAAQEPALIRKHIIGVTYFVLIKLLIQHPILVGRYILTKFGIHINQ